MPITLAIALYGFAWIALVRSLRLRERPPLWKWASITGLGLLAHAYGCYSQMAFAGGYDFAFLKLLSLFFWVAVFLVLLGSLRKPLQNLFLLLLPCAILILFSSLYAGSQEPKELLPLANHVVWHILLSVCAYSAMLVATLQTLLLAYQNYHLRHKHPTGIVRLLPPLLTMEALLFELLWIGQILLTLVIIPGFFQIESVAGQHLHHKIVFTLLAWVIYAILLWGRHSLGWRGNAAIKWSLAGFGLLVLAYIGTKVVLDLILGRV